jgi:hypothetical protein
MQTHHIPQAATPLPPLCEEVCLTCGTSVPLHLPPEDLDALGWHSWVSRVTRHGPLSLLRLCPECTADPMLVATTILANHGPDQLEQWIVSMELKLG